MSTIPPNWLGSIIQTQGGQARAAGDKQKAEAAQTESTKEGTFADKLQDVIDETDRDSQVYSDAEGTGSQGRPSEQPDDDQATKPEDEEREEDRGGLDLQA